MSNVTNELIQLEILEEETEMTMMPIWKTCPKCHMKYSWNPDVGEFKCPYCYGLGKAKKGLFYKILGGKKKGK